MAWTHSSPEQATLPLPATGKELCLKHVYSTQTIIYILSHKENWIETNY